MKYAIDVLLILIGGVLGTISWLVWAGSGVAGYLYGGETVAIATAVVMGKIVTPPWVIGMTREANHRWPAFGRFISGIKPWFKRNLPMIIGVAFWIAVSSLLLIYVQW